MSNPERAQVIVITGASSGIGRALAFKVAGADVHLVLVGRNLEKLHEVAQECEKRGAQTDLQSLDVADAEAVQKMAEEVYLQRGRLDVWVNNAGVGAIGSFTAIPLEDHVRVMQTNFFGYLHGSYAAVKIFKRQGRGTLINNGSISSHLVVPHAASYNASKHAIRALTLSLQQDLRVDGQKNIHVCLVNPEVVDTPAFHHAANYSGKPVQIGMPTVTAEEVAKCMAKLMRSPHEEVFVGNLARLGAFGQRYFPSLSNAILRWGARRYYQKSAGAEKASTAGSLFRADSNPSQSEGGWKSGETTRV